MLSFTPKEMAERLTLAEIDEVRRHKIEMLTEQKAKAEDRARKLREDAEKAAQEAAAASEQARDTIYTSQQEAANLEALVQAGTKKTFFSIPPVPVGSNGLPVKVSSKAFQSWVGQAHDAAKAAAEHGQ